MYDFAIVGGGIVGLATGVALGKKYPNAKILILEKENDWGKHQTGHNSGVIHSGIYYKPGSFKAKFAKQGSQSMVEFCKQFGIEHDICGKVIVATKPEELPLLDNLYERGLANGLDLKKIGPEALKEIEPHTFGLQAIHVPQAGIVNYKQVCYTYVKIISEQGGDLRLGTKVVKATDQGNSIHIDSERESFETKFMINCTGLHSDQMVKKSGMKVDMQIVPFRGEYYEIKPEKKYLVKNLIYPVPNPNFPFLGVHYTRMVSGKVEAGPNAVLSFKREGYKKTDFDLKEFLEIITYPGLWKLGKKYWREGMEEVVRSFSKAAFVKSLQQLIPEIQSEDLEPAPAGVRAQALKPDGGLVDDFYMIPGKNCVHVCNAPSPGATASLEIGKYIVNSIPEQKHLIAAAIS